MRLLRVGEAGREVPALLDGDGRMLDCSGVTDDFDAGFFERGGLGDLAAALGAGGLPVLEGNGLRLGAPVAKPEKIVCIGLNYRDHAEETGAELPKEPVVFMKVPSTLVGPNDQVLVPRLSTKTDWEIELAVIIGTRARYLDSPSEALDHVAGFAISNDVSEREFQLERGGQWDKGKGCETFNPMGPWLVTSDEVGDPQDLWLKLWVNGVQRQNGNTKNMLFGVAHIVWYLSQFMVLQPGDIINTGTPAGVSQGHPDVPFLTAGDVVELEAQSLGRQRSEVGQA